MRSVCKGCHGTERKANGSGEALHLDVGVCVYSVKRKGSSCDE